MLEFNMPKDKSSIIKVMGVGGGGTNAVNHMYRLGIKGVNLIVANTDLQSLEDSPVINKIQLGEKLTEGLGAGTNPDEGALAAIEAENQIREMLQYKTKMLFITAGMGGGTGTGASPIIARLAQEMGILTVAIVTTPFNYEGPEINKQALEGIEELRKYVDALIVISNEQLHSLFGEMDIDEAFAEADNVLAIAAKSIAELITNVGKKNVDFRDVKVALEKSGVAIIGNATAEGENRALRATKDALESPLLNDQDISGARFILINVAYGKMKPKLDELSNIGSYVQDQAGIKTQIKMGHCYDETLENKISVTIVAAGFKKPSAEETEQMEMKMPKVVSLNEDQPVEMQFEVKEEERQSLEDLKFQEETTYLSLEQDQPVNETITIDAALVQPEIELNNAQVEPAQNELASQIELVQAAAPISDVQMPVITTSANDIVLEIVSAQPEAAQSEMKLVQVSPENAVSLDANGRSNEERARLLRSLSMNLNNTSGSSLHTEPAYVRRGVNLDINEPPPSDEQGMSSFMVSQNADQTYELKQGNNFLHGNVD